MKTHNPDKHSDSFADMLAAADGDAAADAQAPKPPATAGTAAPSAQAANQDQDTDDMLDDKEAPATAPLNLAALAPSDSKPQATPSDTATGDKAVGDKDKRKPDETQPANDNAAAQALQQPLPVPPPITAKAAPGDGSTASIGATGTAATQPAANGTDGDAGDDSLEQAAAAQTNQTAANQAAPKSAAGKAAKPATDIKKAVDGAKTAAAKPGAAAAQDKSADAGSDTKQADVKATDAKAVDALAARPADTQAPAAPQTNGPQDALTPIAAPTPANANTPAATILAPQAAPTPHHAPNLNGLAVEIAAKSQAGTKQFDIRLDPPELGRVDVRLAIDANGKTQAHLTADQPQTLDLLQKDAATLTRALRDAGLNVSQDGLNFSLRNQQQQTGHQQSHSQGGRTWRGNFATSAANQTANATGAYSARRLGLLDIKV